MKTVLVIGAGNVGSQIIHYGMARDVAAQFFLLDTDQELETAQVLDLKDTLFFSKNSNVSEINYGDTKITEMDVIIITAGANQSVGETRCDLLQKNAVILKSIAQNLGTLKSEAVVIIVSNPVDILTSLAYQFFDIPQNQIFGTGTLLDSARLCWQIAQMQKVPVGEVSGYVLGEHGDSEFVAWSMVNLTGKLLSTTEQQCIENEVKQEAYAIIKGKGATYFGIAASTITLLNAVLGNTGEVYPVSTCYPHFEDVELQKTPLGVLAKLGEKGVHEVVKMDLPENELQNLKDSAQKLIQLNRSCPI